MGTDSKALTQCQLLREKALPEFCVAARQLEFKGDHLVVAHMITMSARFQEACLELLAILDEIDGTAFNAKNLNSMSESQVDDSGFPALHFAARDERGIQDFFKLMEATLLAGNQTPRFLAQCVAILDYMAESIRSEHVKNGGSYGMLSKNTRINEEKKNARYQMHQPYSGAFSKEVYRHRNHSNLPFYLLTHLFNGLYPTP